MASRFKHLTVFIFAAAFSYVVLFSTVGWRAQNDIMNIEYEIIRVAEHDDRTEPTDQDTTPGDTDTKVTSSTVVSTDHTTSLSSTTPVYHTGNNTRKRRNVLFIIADDMRAQLGCYAGAHAFGNTSLYTPNLDSLAAHSLLLTKAYAQVSLCGPSRSSLLTSRRPDTTKIWHNRRIRKGMENLETLPRYFKRNGYQTFGFGKIFHVDDEKYWTEPLSLPPDREKRQLIRHDWYAVPGEENKRELLMDEFRRNMVMKKLTEISGDLYNPKVDQPPFFMAVGFTKPHLPFVCPEKFYEMYDLETGRQYLDDISWQTPPVGGDDKLYSAGEDLRLSDADLRQLRRGYFACVSYVDSLVGDILRGLEYLGLAQSTIVTFTSDHGFHLGENSIWGKLSIREAGLQVPLMLRIPGLTNKGISSPVPVELVDVFPTLAEAAGLASLPACPVHSETTPLCTDGRSFLSLIRQPRKSIKFGAFSQKNHKGARHMKGGATYTIRTEKYRYSETVRFLPKHKIKANKTHYRWHPSLHPDVELFDLKVDPLERFNITKDPKHKKLQKMLHFKLARYVKGIYGKKKP